MVEALKRQVHLQLLQEFHSQIKLLIKFRPFLPNKDILKLDLHMDMVLISFKL